MKIPSYKEKTYIIEDNNSLIRRAADLTKFEKYRTGDELPPGNVVGDFKKIPQHTEIKVSDVRTFGDRNVCVLAEPVNTGDRIVPSGWTRCTNLSGGFLNELVSFVPDQWDFAPAGDNFTVTDKKALIRNGAPNFTSIGESIPVGDYVLVTKKAQKGNRTFVKVSKAEIKNGKIKATDEIGWTSAANLTEGCTNFFSRPEWIDNEGGNACWKRGRFIGAKVLIKIVGTGGQMEQITLESLEAYMKLKDAAAKKNLTLAITSAFRTFDQQAKLFDLFKKGQGNLAAEPGKSNHQHGQAFDLNTDGFDTAMYKWLKQNGPKLGFVRTVRGEHWHWEYLPDKAPQIAANGGFKTFSGGE